MLGLGDDQEKIVADFGWCVDGLFRQVVEFAVALVVAEDGVELREAVEAGAGGLLDLVAGEL